MLVATYIGNNPEYRGEDAIIKFAAHDRIEAQFNNFDKFKKSGECFGWHSFPSSDWRIHTRERLDDTDHAGFAIILIAICVVVIISMIPLLLL